jgi:hypothetical protein
MGNGKCRKMKWLDRWNLENERIFKLSRKLKMTIDTKN